jgi:hypothetical protein
MMLRRISIPINLILALILTGAALAQGPTPPQGSYPTWQAFYYNNKTLSGSPVLVRNESDINYDWGSRSPDPSINADNFSVRWTRYLNVTPGTYRFTATSDDGIRVWVDNALIINQWDEHPPQTFTADWGLLTGHHLVVVEFYENDGGAVARLSWNLITTPIPYNWRGEYFNNMTLSGAPALVRNDAQIDFNWGNSSPATGVINADKFSAHWTRQLDLPASSYRFTLTVDDGARLWVNNHLLIDTWRTQSPRTYTADIYLPGGEIPIELEYYENDGGAVVQLAWTLVMLPGTVIVDDTDPGFARGGTATEWYTADEGYGGRLFWTRNNDEMRPNYNWVRWHPNLQSGQYEVFVYIPEPYSTTSQAIYRISHADGLAQRSVDQSINSGRWVSLGTFTFLGTSDDYVALDDVTSEPYRTRLIACDAMKWEPR